MTVTISILVGSLALLAIPVIACHGAKSTADEILAPNDRSSTQPAVGAGAPDTSIPKASAISAVVLTSLSLLWYGNLVLKFGFGPDATDLIGIFFLVSLIALVTMLGTHQSQISQNRFLCVVCALALLASALFLGQFFSAFDPFHRVNGRLFPYLLRGLLLGASVMVLISLKPQLFFAFPRWLLIFAGVVAGGWIFVYACPSVLREWYGTRSEPSEFFPEGMLMFTRRNPERVIQGQMLLASVVAWLALVITGRIRHQRNRARHAKKIGRDVI